MDKGIGRVVAALLLGAWCAAANPAAAEEIKVGAGAAPTENVLKPIKGPLEKATGVRLQIISSGPKIALQDLEKGAVDAAAAGLSFDDWMALMKKEGAEVKDPGALRPVTIGKDRIIVLVNKSNPVARLSKEQLTGIFSGTLTNWKEVGGPDLPIIVVIGKLMPGTNSMFAKNMMDDAAMTREALEATTAEDVRQNVAANAEAIGIGPAAVVDASVRSPNTPELSRPIILVTRGAPSAGVQKLLDFIQGEGRKYTVQ